MAGTHAWITQVCTHLGQKLILHHPWLTGVFLGSLLWGVRRINLLNVSHTYTLQVEIWIQTQIFGAKRHGYKYTLNCYKRLYKQNRFFKKILLNPLKGLELRESLRFHVPVYIPLYPNLPSTKNNKASGRFQHYTRFSPWNILFSQELQDHCVPEVHCRSSLHVPLHPSAFHLVHNNVRILSEESLANGGSKAADWTGPCPK